MFASSTGSPAADATVASAAASASRCEGVILRRTRSIARRRCLVTVSTSRRPANVSVRVTLRRSTGDSRRSSSPALSRRSLVGRRRADRRCMHRLRRLAGGIGGGAGAASSASGGAWEVGREGRRWWLGAGSACARGGNASPATLSTVAAAIPAAVRAACQRRFRPRGLGCARDFAATRLTVLSEQRQEDSQVFPPSRTGRHVSLMIGTTAPANSRDYRSITQ